MFTSDLFTHEELLASQHISQSSPHTQYEEWSSTKATLDQAMQVIASIQPQEVVQNVYIKLQQIFHSLATRLEDIGVIMAGFGEQDSAELVLPPPFDAAMEQTTSIPTTAPPQHQENDVVAQIVAAGFSNIKDVEFAVKQAHGNIEIAINSLINHFGFPKPEVRSEVSSLMEPFQFNAPTQAVRHNIAANRNNQNVRNGRNGRKADYSHPPVTRVPQSSPANDANSQVFSPIRTPCSRPTHSPAQLIRTPTGRKSKMAPEEKAALFAAVQNRAPTKDVSGVWEKVRIDLALAGFVKTTASWKGEWSRYGAYEHSFDEKNGVFVTTEKERLGLLRCLEPKPKAAVKRAIEELNGEDGPAKRQKGVEMFEEVDGGFELAGGETPVFPLPAFPQHKPVEQAENIEEVQTPEVDTSINFNFSDVDGAGFGLENGSRPQIMDNWVFGGAENGPESWPWVGDDFGLGFRGDFSGGYDTSFDGGLTLEAVNNGGLKQL